MTRCAPARSLLPALLLALLAPSAATAQTEAAASTLKRARIESADAQALARRLEAAGFDVLPPPVDAADSVDLAVSDAELEALRAGGFAPRVVEVGRPLREILAERETIDGVPSGYSDLDAVLQQMNLAAATFPSICSVVDLTTAYGTSPTFQGRHLFAVKISDAVQLDEDEPAMLLVSNHHAREIVTPVLALDVIERLTAGYGVDPAITAAVDEYEIWIAPTWNPDGYNHVFTVDNFWRKNRRVVPGGIGVDQNRNYPVGWSTPCSGSTSPTSGTYKGPSPASEPETQTMMAFSADRRFAKVLDYHSSGREVLWGFSCSSYPFSSFQMGDAQTLSNASGYGDVRPPSAEGEHYQWQFGATGAMAFLTETHTQFQPSYASALNEAATVWPGVLWMLGRPVPLSGHVTDACSGAPLEASVTLVGVAFNNGESNSSGGPFGRYNHHLPAGPYQVRFEAPGYVARTLPVNVGAGTATVLDVALDPIGAPAVNYCVSTPSSVGPGAILFAGGSVSVAANDFTILASGAAPNEFSIFVYGLEQTQIPLFEGFLCVGGPLLRLPVLVTNSFGDVWHQLDLTNPPQPGGLITPGSTWYFQLFYRDHGLGGTGANLSDGLQVSFCP